MTKLLRNENAFYNVRLVYIICVLLYALARQVIVATQPLFMNGIFNLLVIGGAGVIFLWDIIFFRNIFCMN